ncbi:juvenile hormone acid O-methyltransferase-like [Cataglyphis hispanica]|uniref:juvenile hormone acid O-methyltransferase-like n=1 Tax=Cataglyphis hispanica TaxID=1086592 RepID=UPI00217FB8FB|nr:juvenile hormone acid O-methyltransferase-like [Cataglyphis hispanica]
MIKPAQYVLLDTLCRNNVSLLLDEFDKDLKNISGKCMDIGCGPGDITKDILLPFLGPNVTMIGTDIMEKVIEYANKTYGDKERLKFEVLDIETKNLPDKYISEFDHIFSFHALQWCKDIHQTFRNIYRMLRPSKTMLILSIAHHAHTYESLEAMAQDMRYAAYMGDKNKYVGSFHYSTQPHEELKQILENIGFQVHHCSHRNKSEFLNTQKFSSMITSQYTFEFLNKMPHDLKEEFMNEFIRRFEEIRIEEYKKRQNDDKLHDHIPFYYTVLVVYAQKRL